MGKVRGSVASEPARRAALDLREALGSALDIRVVLRRAYPPLLRLLQADAVALAVSPSGRVQDLEWLVANLPDAFFASYREMAPHDFVRAAVTRSPNVVLRDQEMVSRRALERNAMYRRAREVGAPLEQVMAVMLQVDRSWQSGLAIYRDRRRPFGGRERNALQDATPMLVNAVRNCRLFQGASTWEVALRALLEDRRSAAVLIGAGGTELACSPRAAALLERWFEPHERRPGRLPAPLEVLLHRESPDAPATVASATTWRRRGSESTLTVSLLPLPDGSLGRARSFLLLEEHPHAVSPPREWLARLTPAEQQVCTAVLRGWDNRLVADHIGCAEATVKKHLQSVFDKLGVPSRAALIAGAADPRPR
jgi:DNA-binding CsgD family transcriptional regulator